MSKTYPELSKSGFDSNLYACKLQAATSFLLNGRDSRTRSEQIEQSRSGLDQGRKIF